MKSSVLNMLMLPAWELNDATVANFWQQLRAFRPRLLVAYAGALHQFARLSGTGRDPIPHLHAIVVSAETLSDEARAAIEACFHVPVYNRYGGRDSNSSHRNARSAEACISMPKTVHVEIRPRGAVRSPPGSWARSSSRGWTILRCRSFDIELVILGIMGERAVQLRSIVAAVGTYRRTSSGRHHATDGRIVSVCSSRT